MTQRGSSTAWDEPAVQNAVKRAWRRAVVAFLVSSVVLVGFVVLATVSGERAEELERSGVSVSGEVIRGPGVLEEQVTVRFEWQGRQRFRDIQLTDSSPQYRLGQRVTVLVDANDPSRVSLAGEPNDPPWLVAVMIGMLVEGIFGIPWGLWRLWRLRRQRRLLRRDPWRAVPVRYVQIRRGRTLKPVLFARHMRGETMLVLAATSPSRLAESGLAGADAVQIAGRLDGPVVVRPRPGSDELFDARPPTSWWRQRRWSEAATASEPATTDIGDAFERPAERPSRRRQMVVWTTCVGLPMAGLLYLTTFDHRTTCEAVEDPLAGYPQDPDPVPTIDPRALADHSVPLDPILQTYLLDAITHGSYVLSEETVANLAAHADGQHNPAARQLAVEHGFIRERGRRWTDQSGNGVSHTVMQFSSARNAGAFVTRITRYTCRFAPEHFEVRLPRIEQPGVGLRVRYRGGTIVDQVSWTRANRRHVMAVVAADGKPDRELLQTLAARAALVDPGPP